MLILTIKLVRPTLTITKQRPPVLTSTIRRGFQILTLTVKLALPAFTASQCHRIEFSNKSFRCSTLLHRKFLLPKLQCKDRHNILQSGCCNRRLQETTTVLLLPSSPLTTRPCRFLKSTLIPATRLTKMPLFHHGLLQTISSTCCLNKRLSIPIVFSQALKPLLWTMFLLKTRIASDACA